MFAKILPLLVVVRLALATDLTELQLGSQKFAAGLYSNAPAVIKTTDILYSPYSLQVVLGFTQSGAKGTTGEEIRSSSSLPKTKEDVETVLQTAMPFIDGKLFNKVYVENNYTTNPDFLSLGEEIYRSAFENVEFVKPAEAQKTINEWAAEVTKNRFGGRFTNLADFSKLTKDVLINTYSVSKNWTLPFDSSQTKVESFYNGNYYVNVDMMTRGPSMLNYYECEEIDAKFLEVPLDGEDTSLTIVLPNQMNGIGAIEKKIKLAFETPEYVQERIQLSFPRTTMKFTWLPLKEPLNALGMKNPWQDSVADLSGIAGVPGEIVVNRIMQNTYLNVAENGVEAVAGGYADVWLASTKSFNVNRPFVMYLKVKGVVVMIARVVAPIYEKNF